MAAAVLLPSARPVGADPLASARAQASQVNAQLQADGARLDALDQQYEVALAKVNQLQGQVASDRSAVVQDQAQVAADQQSLRDQALNAYMSGANQAGLATVFGTGGEQAAVTSEYKSLATGSLTNAVDGLNLAQQHLAQQETQLQATENQAQAALSQVDASRRAAAATLASEQSTLHSLNSQIANLVAQQRAAQEAAAYQSYLQRVGTSHGGNLPPAGGAQTAVNAAESQIGVPYEWGGESPGQGFDCSGLTQWSWRQAGVGIPRTANDQYHAIPWVSLSNLEPGDLVFWGSGGYADHVGIYIGNGDVVHAPSSGQTVRVQAIWSDGLLGAGRP